MKKHTIKRGVTNFYTCHRCIFCSQTCAMQLHLCKINFKDLIREKKTQGTQCTIVVSCSFYKSSPDMQVAFLQHWAVTTATAPRLYVSGFVCMCVCVLPLPNFLSLFRPDWSVKLPAVHIVAKNTHISNNKQVALGQRHAAEKKMEQRGV